MQPLQFKVIPWKRIISSKVCIAHFVAHFCSNWGNYLFLTQLPSFMKDVLKFDIKSVSLTSSSFMRLVINVDSLNRTAGCQPYLTWHVPYRLCP